MIRDRPKRACSPKSCSEKLDGNGLIGSFKTLDGRSCALQHHSRSISSSSLLSVSGTYNCLSKVLFIFCSSYLFDIGVCSILGLMRHTYHFYSIIPKIPYSLFWTRCAASSDRYGAIIHLGTSFQKNYSQRTQLMSKRIPQFCTVEPNRFLLSFPGLIDMLKFSPWLSTNSSRYK